MKRTLKYLSLALVILALAGLLTACGGRENDTPAASPAELTPTAPTETPPPPVEEEAAPEAGTDIQPLLGQSFAAVEAVFGNQIYYTADPIHDIMVYFDTGLQVAAGSGGDDIVRGIFLEYGGDLSRTAYHFAGIDGTSTRADVIAQFGDTPHNIREGSDEDRLGAVISYGYWVLEDAEFVRFFFDAADNVVAIHFFWPN